MGVLWVFLHALCAFTVPNPTVAQAPNQQQQYQPTVAEVILGMDSLSILADALIASGLSLPVDEPLTLFAPTDEAWNDPGLELQTGMTIDTLLHPANKHKLVQLLKFHIVPSCIGFYSTFRPSLPLALQLGGSTAANEAGSRRTGVAPVSTPAAGSWPNRQTAPQTAASAAAPLQQARTWQQPPGHATYTVAKVAPRHGPGKGLGISYASYGRRLSQQQLVTPCSSARALRASQLTQGRVMWTALEGAAPLVVSLDVGNNKVKIHASDNPDAAAAAAVEAADTQAGRAIIFTIDQVLVPAVLQRS